MRICQHFRPKMCLFWILLVIKDTSNSYLIRVFPWKYTENYQKVHENDVKWKDFGFRSVQMRWSYNTITVTGLIQTKKYDFPKTSNFSRIFLENLEFLAWFSNIPEHFAWHIRFRVIFGEFLSAFQSKNGISGPFWQEKLHRENDLDWPFEFQAWFLDKIMVFNHDKP